MYTGSHLPRNTVDLVIGGKIILEFSRPRSLKAKVNSKGVEG